MIPYQWTTTGIGIIVAGTILYLVRRSHIHGPYALWWLCVAVGIVILGLFPQIIDALADVLGVNYPPILAVVLGFGLILIKMLKLDLERSRQERKIRRLTQQLAMLEARQPLSEQSRHPSSNDDS